MENIDIEKAVAELETVKEPSEISFIVKDDFVKQLPEILSNCEQVKEWAIESTKADKALILTTDEDYAKAEKRCADINRIIKTIDTKRKEVKKEYNAPYELFENKLKEVILVLNEARDNLWGQVKAAENEEKKKKESELRVFWENLNSDTLGGYRSWEQIFNPKWLNRTTKREVAENEMRDIFSLTVSDVAAIKDLHSEFKVSLIDYYKQGHSLSEAIAYNVRLCEQNKALSKETPTGQADTRPVEETPVKTEILASAEEQEEVVEIDFRVYATKTQLQALKQFLINNKIKYGKVPKGE